MQDIVSAALQAATSNSASNSATGMVNQPKGWIPRRPLVLSGLGWSETERESQLDYRKQPELVVASPQTLGATQVDQLVQVQQVVAGNNSRDLEITYIPGLVGDTWRRSSAMSRARAEK